MRADAFEIDGLHAVADRFDHVLLDQWGTLHDGRAVFAPARDCVARLRESGKRVLVLSNSGKRARLNAGRLSNLGLVPDGYDGMLTSGELTWAGLRERKRKPFTDLGESCYLITRGDDDSIVAGLDVAIVAQIEKADFILLSGLDDQVAEPERWRQCLSIAATRRLPMLCANPDLTMLSGTRLLPAPGMLAQFYEKLGGAVIFIGKPHAPIFEAALEHLGKPDPKRVLMIGDSLDHDIAGARAAGLLTLLLTSGVHRDVLASAPDVAGATRALAGSQIRTPNWTMNHLAW